MRGREIALGPGKVDLLEAVRRTGSISSAAREQGLSYRRAWGMVDVMNRCFAAPLIARSVGGRGGGGACVTPDGERVIGLYRSMEAKARKAASREWKGILAMLKKTGK
jgi:molybdate transport system regulatory protein